MKMFLWCKLTVLISIRYLEDSMVRELGIGSGILVIGSSEQHYTITSTSRQFCATLSPL